MDKRSNFSTKDEAAALTRCRRRCCLCFGLTTDASVKRGQLAHLDHDRSNKALENAVFLCFDHHDEYDSSSTQSKKFTVAELRTYREQLYSAIERGALPEDEGPLPPIYKLHPTFNTTTGDKSMVLNVAGDVNLNPRVIRKNVIRPGAAHVSPEQALEIRTRVVELAELEAKSGRELAPARWYKRLYAAFGITSYRLTPAHRYDEVIAWMQKQAALLRPHLRRSNNSEWRNSLYKGIWARSRELRMSKQDVHSFAATVLGLSAPVETLTDLPERQLKTVYDTLFRYSRT